MFLVVDEIAEMYHGKDRALYKGFLNLFCVLVVFGLVAAPVWAGRNGDPHLYGQVVIDNGSTAAGMAPVVFDHWVHRSRITCRVCHLDLGIAMRANATGISATDIQGRRYCGTCHNGQATYDGKPIFSACSPASGEDYDKACARCHRRGDDPELKKAFQRLAGSLPRERFGNHIDWEKAEAMGLIRPVDYIEGVSTKRPDKSIEDDFSLHAKEAGMPDIIFSHRKHIVWNGCGVCHPAIFLGGKKGNTQYSMQDLFAGKYCGVCHDKVAFPQKDCQRCHTALPY